MSEYLFWGGPLHRKIQAVQNPEWGVAVSQISGAKMESWSPASREFSMSAVKYTQVYYERQKIVDYDPFSPDEEIIVTVMLFKSSKRQYDAKTAFKHVPKHWHRRVDRRTGAVLH